VAFKRNSMKAILSMLKKFNHEAPYAKRGSQYIL
jgi:hypothetical protein